MDKVKGVEIDPVREKLIELPNNSFDKQYSKRGLLTAPHTADDLIASGVVISNSETTTKWIPVTERLPEDRTQVLCFGGAYGWKSTKMARFTTCLEDYHEYDFEGQQRHGFFNYDSEYGYYEETDVTHWMPLPEPPKGE